MKTGQQRQENDNNCEMFPRDLMTGCQNHIEANRSSYVFTGRLHAALSRVLLLRGVRAMNEAKLLLLIDITAHYPGLNTMLRAVFALSRECFV